MTIQKQQTQFSKVSRKLKESRAEIAKKNSEDKKKTESRNIPLVRPEA